jgi:hypothetical protein
MSIGGRYINIPKLPRVVPLHLLIYIYAKLIFAVFGFLVFRCLWRIALHFNNFVIGVYIVSFDWYKLFDLFPLLLGPFIEGLQ